MQTLLLLPILLLSFTSAMVLQPRQNSSAPTAPPSNSSSSSCPPNLKAITFNGGYSPSQFDTIGAASHWTTFSLSITNNPPPSPHTLSAHIPMMAFASDVAPAVDLVNGPSPPEWLLTFNEPDFAYAGTSPTMSPEQAADAIKPLLERPGLGATKYVAPVTADPNSDWLPRFYAACGCQSFFSAYNIHIYTPSIQRVKDGLTAFHAKFDDKPIWLTEVAPGGASPACSVGWDEAGEFMREVYRWAAGSGWVERVFWNSGNRIGGGDTNVCDSWLVGERGEVSPLVEVFRGVDCR